MNLLFVILGAVAIVAGITMLVRAIRSGANARPRNTALLIGGMMLTAFGLLLAGFSIGYATSEPLDLNSAQGA